MPSSVNYVGLQAGVWPLWGGHVCECGMCVDTVQLMVADQIVHEYLNIAHLASVRDQLHATPGSLRVTVINSGQCPQGA